MTGDAPAQPVPMARIDPPPALTASVLSLQAQCAAWKPVPAIPHAGGNPPALTNESRICDAITGHETPAGAILVTGILTGIVAGLLLRWFLRLLWNVLRETYAAAQKLMG